MARIRKTKRWGNSDVIVLNSLDKLDLDIEIGEDRVDIEDMKIIKEKENKK
jgi:hypothetical protein